MGSSTPTGEIVAGDDTSECADNNGGSTTPGTAVQMWDCNGGANQQWSVH